MNISFSARLKKIDVLLLIVILSALFMRLTAIQMVVLGGEDVCDTWGAAKTLIYGGDYYFFHRTSRFGAIIPVYITQLFFGTKTVVYYIAPALFQIAQVFFLYKISEKIMNKPFAFMISITYLIFPDTMIAGSHPRTSSFAILYILAMFYFMIKHISSDKKISVNLILSAVMSFLIYMTTDIAVFFIPGMLIYVMISKKRLHDSFTFTAVFLILFLTEWLSYYLFAGLPLGRIGIIMSGHMEGGTLIPLYSWIQLFERFSPRRAGIYWTITLLLFTASSIFILKNHFKNKICAIIFSGLIFIIFITFTLKSVNPIIPVANFRARYLNEFVPIALVVIFFAAYSLRRNKITMKFKGRILLILILILSSLMHAAFYSKKYYGNFTSYINNYPLKLSAEYDKKINEAYEKGTPIVIKGQNVPHKQYEDIYNGVQKFIKMGHSLEKSLELSKTNIASYRTAEQRLKKIFFSGDYSLISIFLNQKEIQNYLHNSSVKAEEIKINESHYYVFIKDKTDDIKKYIDTHDNVLEVKDKPFRIHQTSLKQN